MRLPEPRRPGSRDDQLIPLINVVFLLLLFFLLVGRVTAPAPLGPTLPVSSTAPVKAPVKAQEGPTLWLEADGRLAWAGQPVAMADLAGVLTRSAGGVPRTLVLEADAGVALGRLRETLAALAAAGVERVTLLTVPVR